eukprot:TRINITY_DN7467_c0_g1_i2.p1 TRINITY_DN7467_c0_g1~~TRINITY_DN7467_c0_g1_i2.p1  ORF type:complete len:434 (+),score=41.55 TRINITY_DN7467_c0_g1_i2:104-1303(+)
MASTLLPQTCLFLASLPIAYSCTYFEAPAPRSASKIVSRSMEFFFTPKLTDWHVFTHPRGTTYPIGNESKGTVKYGHVSIDTNGVLPGRPADGMNEQGLSISCNVFLASDYAPYEPRPASDTKTLLAINLARWALSEFNNTADLVESLSEMTVSDFPMAFSGFLLHWAVADALGDSRVIECTNGTGRCEVYKNEVGVLTNDPAYPWMVENLNTYAFLSPHWVLSNNDAIQKKTQFGAIPASSSAGYNLKGLPGDSTPPSRFVKVFYEREYALLNEAASLASVDDYLFLNQAIMNSVFIPKGVEATKNDTIPTSFTQWTVMKLPDQQRFFLRSYNDMQWREIDLTNLALTEGSKPVSLAVEVKGQTFHELVKPPAWNALDQIDSGTQQATYMSVTTTSFV